MRNACSFPIETDDQRPFSFADLGGRPEPDRWGPKYSRPIKVKRTVNDETNIPTNCASGQKGDFDAAKHRAKIRAESEAAARAQAKRVPDRALIAAYRAAKAEKNGEIRLAA